MDIKIVVIETPSLGDCSYLIHDGKDALVVDPQRDIDRIADLASREGVVITAVAETHMHNDYVSGGLAAAPPERRAPRPGRAAAQRGARRHPQLPGYALVRRR